VNFKAQPVFRESEAKAKSNAKIKTEMLHTTQLLFKKVGPVANRSRAWHKDRKKAPNPSTGLKESRGRGRTLGKDISDQ
jgi:hypothetical protein